MTPKSASLYLVGGAVLMVYLERFTRHKDPGRATPIFVPDDVPVPVGPQPPRVAAPRQMPPGPVQAVPGFRYFATINVSFPLSAFASVDKARREAESRGFTSVSVTRTPPPGWPGAKGDYHVSAIYSGSPRTMARSEAAGQATVIDVWQQGV